MPRAVQPLVDSSLTGLVPVRDVPSSTSGNFECLEITLCHCVKCCTYNGVFCCRLIHEDCSVVVCFEVVCFVHVFIIEQERESGRGVVPLCQLALYSPSTTRVPFRLYQTNSANPYSSAMLKSIS